MDAATRDEERPLRPLDQGRGGLDVPWIRARSADVVDLRLEEPRREVVRLRLDVLREREEGRAARRRVEHHRQRLGERADDLGGLGDPVPVAADGLERVGHGHGRVTEVLDLLEDGIDDPVLEGVAGEEEDRQAIGVGDGGGRHHVGRAGSDRRGGDHDPPATHGLGVGHARERHRLLVLAAVRRQLVLHRLERLGEGRHVAMTEDREDPGEERDLLTVDPRPLREQPSHDRLGRGESDRLHGLVILERASGGRSSRPGGTAPATS